VPNIEIQTRECLLAEDPPTKHSFPTILVAFALLTKLWSVDIITSLALLELDPPNTTMSTPQRADESQSCMALPL